MHPHVEDANLKSTRSTPTEPISAALGRDWIRHADPSWLEGWEPRRFELAGGHTEVVVAGQGPALILLPPLPGFKEAWVRCVAPLARKHRVVTFDLRWTFTDGPRWPQLLDDLSRIVEAFAPGPLIVVGHSLGGALAQQWTLANPERVRALVLSSSFVRVFTPRGQQLSRYVAQPLVLAAQRLLPRALALAVAKHLAARGGWVFDAHCDEAVLDLVRHCVRKTPLAAARRMVEVALAHDPKGRLAEIRCPTMVLVGERDSPFALQAAGWLAKAIPSAVRKVSPEVGHLHPMSGPDWLVETIDTWLSEQHADR